MPPPTEKSTETVTEVTTATETEASTEASADIIEPYVAELEPGAYYVGLHIPEGIYNVKVISGIGNIMTTSGVTSAMGSNSAAEYAETYDNLTLENGDVLKVTQSLSIEISTEEAYYSTVSTYENPATERQDLSPGNYVVGENIPAGIYDISILEGTANVSLDDYSFTAMFSDNETLSESSGSSYKNLELLEGQTLQVSSGSVTLEPVEVKFIESEK